MYYLLILNMGSNTKPQIYASELVSGKTSSCPCAMKHLLGKLTAKHTGVRRGKQLWGSFVANASCSLQHVRTHRLEAEGLTLGQNLGPTTVPWWIHTAGTYLPASWLTILWQTYQATHKCNTARKGSESVSSTWQEGHRKVLPGPLVLATAYYHSFPRKRAHNTSHFRSCNSNTKCWCQKL